MVVGSLLRGQKSQNQFVHLTNGQVLACVYIAGPYSLSTRDSLLHSLLKFKSSDYLVYKSYRFYTTCLRTCSILGSVTAVAVPLLGFCVLPPKCISLSEEADVAF